MKEKVLAMIGFAVVAYGLPLLAQPGLLLTPQIALLLAGTAVLFATQPAIRPADVAADRGRDRSSALLILLGFLAAQMAAVIEWAWLNDTQAWHLDGWTVAGIAMLVGGIALRVWSIRLLGRHFTATVRVTHDQRIVRSGPYRRIRHPSYLGALIASLGCAVLLHAGVAFVIGLAILLAVYRYRIAVEERALVEQFGDAYARYQRDSYRLVPFVY